MPIKKLIRTIPDFPKPGIMFRDVTTLFQDPEGFRTVIEILRERYADQEIDAVVGVESRGFIVGAPLALALGCAFIPMRKPGKLPVRTVGIDYALEYGRDRLEIDPGAVAKGARVVIVDDLIATGGTALAATELLRGAGARVDHALFVIDLPDLHGADRLRGAGVTVDALMDFPGH
jgi:adenine phosphoribosyltransferase